MKRLEQQVLPEYGHAIPAPTRGYSHLAPPDTRGPDLSAAQEAMRNLANLTVHLGHLREKAQNEADELAMLEFDGWVKREQLTRAEEFAKLPLADQTRAAEEYRTRFVEDAREFAANLDLSDRRRQVVSRLIDNRGGEFGARLGMESTRRLEKSNCDKAMTNFRGSIDAGKVREVREWYAWLDKKGIDPGITLEQAVSRASFVNLRDGMAAKSNVELDEQIAAIDAELKKNDSVFIIDDAGTGMLRHDMERLRDAALKARSERYARDYEEIAKLKAQGELDEAGLDAMLKTGRLTPRQYKSLKSEFAAERRETQKINYDAEMLYLQDARNRRLAAETDEQRTAIDAEIEARGKQWDAMVKSGALNDGQMKVLRSGVAAAEQQEDKRIAAERSSRVTMLDVQLSQMEFRASADKYDGSFLAVRDAILNTPDLTGAERKRLLRTLNGKVKGVWKTDDGKKLDTWLKDNFMRKKTVNGQTKRTYVDLKWDPGSFWSPDFRKENSQEFQAQRYLELRAYGERLLAEGKPLGDVENTLFEMARKLRDNELPGEAKEFIIDGVTPEKYRAKPDPGTAAALREGLSQLPRDRKSAEAIRAAEKNAPVPGPAAPSGAALGKSTSPEGTTKFYNNRKVTTKNGVWVYAE